MDYTTASGNVTDAQGRRQFVDRNDAAGVQGTYITQADLNAPQNEIVGAIKESGQVPSADNEGQITVAMKAFSTLPLWSQAIANAIGGYSEYAVVVGVDGRRWMSLTAQNKDAPGGSSDWQEISVGMRNMVSITETQEWTVPPGVFLIFAKYWGAGGAGGLGDNGGAGSGGNGGQYVEMYLAVTPGKEILLQVGAAGVPSSTPGMAGKNGGDTTVAGVAARGGVSGGEGNGTGGASNGNPPTTAVANGIALPGQGGTNAILFQTNDSGIYQAGLGGGSPGGGGTAFSAVAGRTGTSNGSTGSYPGGGGGGGINAPGGYGSVGLIVIHY
nr:hypothetical protein [uncultured Acetobacter sp.]